MLRKEQLVKTEDECQLERIKILSKILCNDDENARGYILRSQLAVHCAQCYILHNLIENLGKNFKHLNFFSLTLL
jgi:hypothetical protein